MAALRYKLETMNWQDFELLRNLKIWDGILMIIGSLTQNNLLLKKIIGKSQFFQCDRLTHG